MRTVQGAMEEIGMRPQLHTLHSSHNTFILPCELTLFASDVDKLAIDIVPDVAFPRKRTHLQKADALIAAPQLRAKQNSRSVATRHVLLEYVDAVNKPILLAERQNLPTPLPTVPLARPPMRRSHDVRWQPVRVRAVSRPQQVKRNRRRRSPRMETPATLRVRVAGRACARRVRRGKPRDVVVRPRGRGRPSQEGSEATAATAARPWRSGGPAWRRRAARAYMSCQRAASTAVGQDTRRGREGDTPQICLA